MLRTLTIKNFAIIDHIHLEFDSGLSVITGETGAGKSILIESIRLILGQRAHTRFIKDKNKKLFVSADFDISGNPIIKQWLHDRGLDGDGDCILRRTVEDNMRSHAYINDTAVSLARLKELGTLLIDIVGQNTHQFLLNKKNHLAILDAQCKHPQNLKKMRDLHAQWTDITRQLAVWHENSEAATEKVQLLEYQLRELDDFSPQPDEFPELEREYQRLAKIDTLVEQAQRAGSVLSSDNEQDICSRLARTIRELEAYSEVDTNLSTARDEMNTALMHLTIASEEINTVLSNADMDKQRFDDLASRFSKYMELAKKYNVAPEQLEAFHCQRRKELEALESPQAQIEEMEKQREIIRQEYQKLAVRVSKRRHSTARALEQEVGETLKRLSMPAAVFNVAFVEIDNIPNSSGIDAVEFMIAANAGQTPHPLIQIASGGELSRVNLAIQTALPEEHPAATMIFDEVDVGVGGKTAETIGELLHQLGADVQLLCITHLPQIAAYAHAHYRVEKTQLKDRVSVAVAKLDYEERSHEIARMLGGTKVSASTLAHAREILDYQHHTN